MKYICNNCNKNFGKDAEEQIESLLFRYLLLVCPYCKSGNVILSEQGKLLIERQTKINKLYEPKKTNKKIK